MELSLNISIRGSNKTGKEDISDGQVGTLQD